MNKSIARSIVALFLLAIVFISVASNAPVARAQKPLPPNNPHRGLIYDGLEVSDTGECKGAFKVKTHGNGNGNGNGNGGDNEVLCTPGPDPSPADLSFARATAQGSSSTSVTGAVVCDGDGASGSRVQVIYAHASDMPDRYATYAASFQQWVGGADTIFNNSAAQTSGTRHVRFVTDASCNAVIPDVTLSTTGDDTFANTISELRAKGYNRTDRKYFVFADANVYCGISTIATDDSAGSSNKNNSGNTFSRLDSGCWSSVLVAHETAHQLGAVQLTAPHSDGNWHCNDGNDTICNYAGHTIQTVCTSTSAVNILDCNHDDYFSTKPPAGNYLATHWNSANNQFLISASPPTPTPTPSPTPKPSPTPTAIKSDRIDSITTGTVSKNTFTAASTFTRGNTVTVRAHAVDQNNANLSSVSVSLTVNKPEGSPQCSLSGSTDTSGNVQVSCAIPTTAPVGTWKVNIVSFSKSGFTSNTTQSVATQTFTVK